MAGERGVVAEPVADEAKPDRRRALVAAAYARIRGVIGHAMQRFAETLPRDGSPVEQLRGHLRALCRLLKEDQQLWAVMGELVLRAPRDAELGRIFRQTDAYWYRTLRDLISRCIEQGTIDPSLNPDDMA